MARRRTFIALLRLVVAASTAALSACTSLVVFANEPADDDDGDAGLDAAPADVPTASVPGVDGGAWRAVPSPTSQDLLAVWGSRSDDVWAVGEGGTALHWDGASWTRVATGSSGSLQAVWGSRSDDVWAVGSEGVDTAVALHWDGTAWTRDSSVAGAYPMRGVWGSASNDVWAIGGAVEAGNDMVLHWNGAAWSPVGMEGQFTPYLGVWGSAADDVWVVTDDQSVDRWDGADWRSVGDRPWRALLTGGVWLGGYQDVWFAGMGGYVYRDNHGAWTRATTGFAGTLHAVSGSASADVWVVGDQGAIAHWNGTEWVPVASLTPNTLWGVWAAGPTDVWSAGGGGVLLRFAP